MNFRSLEILNGYETKIFKFGDKTEIYSNLNSVGKSTLLRLLFYSMGYHLQKELSFLNYKQN